MSIKRGRAIAWVLVVNLVITVGLLEGLLRVQQKLGPLYELSISPETIPIGLSDELNHVPEPGPDWEPNGLRKLDQPNAANCGPRILFLGDSFMQGYGPTDSVPYHVRRYFKETLGKDLCVFNAGTSSYSPSVFVPQAKKLIPLLRPDLIVIDVDETDLWDDYYRYRQLVTKDATGSIAAVRATPINVQFHQGLVESTDKIFYLHRLFSKLYFTKYKFPTMSEQYNQTRPTDGFFLSKLSAAEATTKHRAEIDYFKATLEDLTQTVLSRMGTPDALIYIHHPHLEHLRTTGVVFNNVISAAVQETALRHGVKYYDATDELRKKFGVKPESYYFPNDMHLNAAGLRAYGTAVARYLAHRPEKN